MTTATEVRPLWMIAKEIRKDWKNVNYAAKPYLEVAAMKCRRGNSEKLVGLLIDVTQKN
jgi:hypothetical protein